VQDRVNLSIFGQLFRELHFLKPTALRMGYTHPMDDGQERTFKVKFEGEGVDDYGGPYREVFAQIPTELQMTPPLWKYVKVHPSTLVAHTSRREFSS